MFSFDFCRLIMKILIFLLHLITQVESRKLVGPVDLAIIFEESGFGPRHYNLFRELMDEMFDMNTPKGINIYTICDGLGYVYEGWHTCGGGTFTDFQKNFDRSMAKANHEFFRTKLDRRSIKNMLFLFTDGNMTRKFTPNQAIECENIATDMTEKGIMIFVFRWYPVYNDGEIHPALISSMLNENDVAIMEKIAKFPDRVIYVQRPKLGAAPYFRDAACFGQPNCEAKPKEKRAKCVRDFSSFPGGCYEALYEICDEYECECSDMYPWNVSQCSETCGVGYKFSKRNVLPGSKCNTTKIELCTLGHCPITTSSTTTSTPAPTTTPTTTVPTTTTIATTVTTNILSTMKIPSTTPAMAPTTTTLDPTTITTIETAATTTPAATTAASTTTTVAPGTTTISSTGAATIPTTMASIPTSIVVSTTTPEVTKPRTTTNATAAPSSTKHGSEETSKQSEISTTAESEKTPTNSKEEYLKPSLEATTTRKESDVEETSSSESTVIIIGVAVGGALLLIAVVAIVLVMVCRKSMTKTSVSKSADLSTFMKDDRSSSRMVSPSSSMVKSSILSKGSQSISDSKKSSVSPISKKSSHGKMAGVLTKEASKRSVPGSPSSTVTKGSSPSSAD